MSESLYIPPYKNWGLFGNVAATGIADEHELAWAVDGRPGFPIRITGTGAVITITNTAQMVNLIALCSHLLDAGLVVAVSGDITDNVTVPAATLGLIPHNAWKSVTPTMTDTITLTITGNSGDPLIGEIVIGEALSLEPRLKLEGSQWGRRQLVNPTSNNELAGIQPYNEYAQTRPLSGSQYYDETTINKLFDWYDSQFKYAYQVPSLFVPYSNKPKDARLVTLLEPQYSQTSSGDSDTDDLWLVQLSFVEYVRGRW